MGHAHGDRLPREPIYRRCSRSRLRGNWLNQHRPALRGYRGIRTACAIHDVPEITGLACAYAADFVRRHFGDDHSAQCHSHRYRSARPPGSAREALMIAGLDSAQPPTVAQVDLARANGVHMWAGYIATVPNVGLV